MRIALIGTGYIARRHAAAIRNSGAEVAAAVNWRAETLGRFADELGVARTYASVDELLAAGGVDAAVICTPNALHADQGAALLGAGLHVLVEKPMAAGAAQAAALADAARQSGRALMVAHCWRFDTEVMHLRACVAAGELGRVVRTRGYGIHTGWAPGGWFADPALSGGGALADMGVHAIDTARFLLGDPRAASVYAHVGTHYGEGQVDDTALVMITWEGGAVSYIEAGWRHPHTDGPAAATQLYGTEGFGQLFPTYLTLKRHGRTTELRPSFPQRLDHTPQQMYDRQMAAFLRAARGEADPSPGPDDGLEIMRVLDAAYESGRSGSVVQLLASREVGG
jgi:predicted dehydrogenase